MTWPFPEYLRPIMRSYLWYLSQGYDPSEARDRLIGPPGHLRERDVDQAIPEALRALYFRQAIEAAPPEQPLATTFAQCAGPCFEAAYGRAPSAGELSWALTQPQAQIGLMFVVNVPATAHGEGRKFPVTVNAPWSATLEQVEEYLREQLADLRPAYSPPVVPIVDPTTLTLQLVGGALVQRIEPTVTLPPSAPPP